MSALTELSGELIAGGDFSSAGGVAANHIARWDGTAWSPLGTGTDGPVRTFLVQAGVILYAGGAFATPADKKRMELRAGLRASGRAWARGLEGEVRALAFAREDWSRVVTFRCAKRRSTSGTSRSGTALAGSVSHPASTARVCDGGAER